MEGAQLNHVSPFWKRENFILPFAVNVMLNLSNIMNAHALKRVKKKLCLYVIAQDPTPPHPPPKVKRSAPGPKKKEF